MTTRDHLPPIGWPLLPLPRNGALHYPSLEQSVRETLEAILRTNPGEQLMDPTFGGGLEQFLNLPNTIETRRRIRDAVSNAVNAWERRVVLDRVEVWDVPDRPTHLQIEIGYRLRRTGATQQIAVTLELQS